MHHESFLANSCLHCKRRRRKRKGRTRTRTSPNERTHPPNQSAARFTERDDTIDTTVPTTATATAGTLDSIRFCRPISLMKGIIRILCFSIRYQRMTQCSCSRCGCFFRIVVALFIPLSYVCEKDFSAMLTFQSTTNSPRKVLLH